MPSSPPLSNKRFGKSRLSLDLPYLLEIQRVSWKRFWGEEFLELLKEISPIRDYTKKEFELWFTGFSFGDPNYKSEVEAKENNNSFEASVRLKVRLLNLKTKEVKE